MTMLNFLIIGAAKAGTTALYEYLRQHPQMHMSPEKGPKFFALEGEKLDFHEPDRSLLERCLAAPSLYPVRPLEVARVSCFGFGVRATNKGVTIFI